MDNIKIKKVLLSLIAGNDYRIEIINTINSQFLTFTIEFFKKVVDAKMRNKDITIDWYKKEFLNVDLPSKDIAINAGINRKTITNMHNSACKSIVINASYEHYDRLYEEIRALVDLEDDLNLNLTIKLGQVSVDLNISESLIVINTIAVKRAEIRGGAWSKVGKNVEEPLMLCLCLLHKVKAANYSRTTMNGEKTLASNDKNYFSREVDFYLLSNGKEHKCEVKLMGKGNPESADAVIARDSSVFVADKLSGQNKSQLNSLGVNWVELRGGEGVNKFGDVLTQLKIPHTKPKKLDKELKSALSKILP